MFYSKEAQNMLRCMTPPDADLAPEVCEDLLHFILNLY